MSDAQDWSSGLSLAPLSCSHGHKIAAQAPASHPQSKWNKREDEDQRHVPAESIHFYRENCGFPWSPTQWSSTAPELCGSALPAEPTLRKGILSLGCSGAQSCERSRRDSYWVTSWQSLAQPSAPRHLYQVST